MKALLVIILIVYSMFFAIDYVVFRRKATKEFCSKWFEDTPLWGHLLVPGPGNACLDLGYRK